MKFTSYKSWLLVIILIIIYVHKFVQWYCRGVYNKKTVLLKYCMIYYYKLYILLRFKGKTRTRYTDRNLWRVFLSAQSKVTYFDCNCKKNNDIFFEWIIFFLNFHWRIWGLEIELLDNLETSFFFETGLGRTFIQREYIIWWCQSYNNVK